MVAYETIVEPEAFRTAIAAWRNEPQLWLDTEVADWFTKTPMLSLLQVRNAVGRKWVVDVIEPNMRVVLEEEFIPQIMANDRIEKWAHYARFERKFLGQERVKNLNCTFERARSIPYYRLPLRSLSLAALADHFCKIKLDKTFQKADWGTRPLKPEQLEYAASDTEWCYRIYDELRKIPSPPDSSKDKPVEIEARYVELLGPWNMARAERQCIRDAVEEFMIHRKLSRHSRFSFSSRKTYSTDLTTLINFAQENDPGECADLRISLSERLRSLIGDNALEQIRPLADIRISQTFRGPRAPRLRDNPPSLYKHARDAV